MTLSSAYIELFIRGKVRGEISGGECPDTHPNNTMSCFKVRLSARGYMRLAAEDIVDWTCCGSNWCRA